MNELISVVIPVYNVEQYLERCIESVLKQTYKELEIILVDDGSKDKSGTICDRYSSIDKRIKVIHKENGGLSEARNVGIEMAKADYITFIDSDDYIKYDYIEVLYKILKENNADISICRYLRVYDSHENNTKFIEDKLKIFSGKEALRTMLYSTEVISQSAYAKLYRKDLFKNVCYPVGRLHEDIGTTYKLFLKAKKIVYTANQYYYYYQRRDGIVHSDFNEKKMDAIFLSEELLNYLRENIPDLINAAMFYTFSQNIQVLIKIPLDDKKYRQQVKYIKGNIKKYRMNVLSDNEVSFKKRLGALFTIFGLRFTKLLAKIYKRIINNEIA